MPAQVSAEERIWDILRGVRDPELHRSIVELDMVREVKVRAARADVTIALTIAGCPLKAVIEEDVKSAILRVPGITEAHVRLDVMTQEERQRLSEKLGGGPTAAQRSSLLRPDSPTTLIAVASGKGGVGKSTVAVNLAAALHKLGYSVGVLDADILGHSIPLMLGIEGRQPTFIDDVNLFIPVPAHGLRVMSTGFFAKEENPVVWRAPLVNKMFDELLGKTFWDDPDFFIIDLPPGTGDMMLNILQVTPQARIVIVTTPQRAAVQVAMRVGTVALKLGRTVAGVVENMSYFLCPACGGRTHVFGHGGGEEAARRLGVPFLGEIPLGGDVAETGDGGVPIVLAQPASPFAEAYTAIARELAGAAKRRPAAAAGS